MDWKTLLAYITRSVDQELLLRNEYLVTENRISSLRGPVMRRPGTISGIRNGCDRSLPKPYAACCSC